LKGVIKVGAVDMTTDEDAGKPYGISGFPSIKFFGFEKSKPSDY
jgi:protein disulfide-isomerase A6